MISIVSPAKSLNFDASCSIKMYSQCSFLRDSQLLVNDLKKYSPEQISDLMKVSDKLGLLNADRYKIGHYRLTKVIPNKQFSPRRCVSRIRDRFFFAR